MAKKPPDPRKLVALVCTNFTMQSAFGLLILALNSARLGYETLIYFTKEIPYVEDMLEMAQLEGVKFLACKTSADLFDLTEDDFMDGVQVMLAEDFVKRAAGSDLHLVL